MPAKKVTINKNRPLVFKRIRLPDLDSISPVVVSVSSLVRSDPSVDTSEMTTNVKERRFRNMVEMFPGISPLVLKNSLVKHGWNEERSREELLKHDPETDGRASSSSSFTGSCPGFSGRTSNPNRGSTVRVPAKSKKKPQNRMPAKKVTVNRNRPMVFKRIRLPDLDSVSPVAGRAHSASSLVRSGPTVDTPELTTNVKERRFRNMLEMFPNMSLLFLKNTLVKHGWNEERSRDELMKYDPETNNIFGHK